MLSWDRPEELNGEIMTYQLWVNGRRIYINDDDSMNETFTYNLNTNLEHFTNYTITVHACNSECSQPSESLNVKTRMGNPGRMLQPSIEKSNEKLIVKWRSPERAINAHSYYQMQVDTLGQIITYRILGDAVSCVINLPDCIDDKIEVSLRTINLDAVLKTELRWKHSDKCYANLDLVDIEAIDSFHAGFWSPAMTYYCNSTEWYITDLLVIAVLVMAFVAAYLVFRWYKCYQQMKDIHVTWPKGFDPELFMSASHSITSKQEKVSSEICEIWRADSTIKHELSDVEENEEESDGECESQFDDSFNFSNVQNQLNDAKPLRDESLQPFIVNPITNEISFLLPKQLNRESTQLESTKDTHVDDAGYMRMKHPNVIKPKIDPLNEGYLDMTGKSAAVNSESLDSEELEEFLRDSQNNKDGYIGKRRSGFMESLRRSKQLNEKEKKATQNCNVNANGYVGVNILRK